MPEKLRFYPQLKPVMSLKGRITNIHTMPVNDGVSYGHTFVAKENTKVATVPIGYADGVPRALSNKISAIINNKKVSIQLKNCLQKNNNINGMCSNKREY